MEVYFLFIHHITGNGISGIIDTNRIYLFELNTKRDISNERLSICNDAKVLTTKLYA